MYNLDTRERNAYKTKNHGTVYLLAGSQDFEHSRVIVWMDNKRGYVSCPMIGIDDGYGGCELAFLVDWDVVYISHFMNGDMNDEAN